MKTTLRLSQKQVDPAAVRGRQKQFVQLLEQQPVLGVMLGGFALHGTPIHGEANRQLLCELGWTACCQHPAVHDTDVELFQNCIVGRGLKMQLVDALDGTPLLQTEMVRMQNGQEVNRLIADQIFEQLEDWNRKAPQLLPELLRLERYGDSRLFGNAANTLYRLGWIDVSAKTALQPIVIRGFGKVFKPQKIEALTVNPLIAAVLRNAVPQGYESGFLLLQSIYGTRADSMGTSAQSNGSMKHSKRERRRKRHRQNGASLQTS